MVPFDTELAWLAGIIDGEGCFSVKRGRGAGRSHQLWLVICNTSEAMILRVVRILDALGVKHSKIRKVWKGEKATRYRATHLDRVMLDSMSAIKRNGGEAPADVAELLCEVIPSQAVVGNRQADDQAAEGVETRSVRPTNNPTHECPASLAN